MHRQKSVQFKETVEISKENGNRKELDIGRVSVKVRQQLDGFGEEKPQDEYEERCQRGHDQSLSRGAYDGLIQQVG